MTIRSKRDLEVLLSKLDNFENPSFQLEQYPTPSNIAAEWIWSIAMKGETAGRVFLDAACGSGILGIGLLLMGAKRIYFLDKDNQIMQICVKNYKQIKKEYEIGDAEFIVEDISLFDEKVDIVVENPPFGTKEIHLDKKFLEKAFTVSTIIYSMHKYTTKVFVEAICKEHNFKITDLWRFEFPIKSTFKFHQKPVKMIDVGLWRMEYNKI